MICTGETNKDHVKMTFPKGASLEDPSGLFSADLKGAPGERSKFMRTTRLTLRP
jgi:hypothetical protein